MPVAASSVLGDRVCRAAGRQQDRAVVAMLQRKNGATRAEIMDQMGWQKHASAGSWLNAAIGTTSNLAPCFWPAQLRSRRAVIAVLRKWGIPFHNPYRKSHGLRILF